MAQANIIQLRIEIEDERASLFAYRADRKGGWNGRFEISISGIDTNSPVDLVDLLTQHHALAKTPPTQE
jgi:hypothetical protein